MPPKRYLRCGSRSANRTASASRPTPVANVAYRTVVVEPVAASTLAKGISIACVALARNRAAATGFEGSPSIRARTLVVPAGMMPSAVALPAIPLTT